MAIISCVPQQAAMLAAMAPGLLRVAAMEASHAAASTSGGCAVWLNSRTTMCAVRERLQVTSVVLPQWDPAVMLEWKDFQTYGGPAALTTAIVYLVAKLIERGFTFRVPPKDRSG